MKHVLKCTGYDVFDIDIVKGTGCYLYDADAKEYVDFEAGVWCTALGHSNLRINNAIKEQLDNILHLGYKYNNTIVEGAAEKVLELIGFKDGKSVFLSSGSEAVEFGVQAIRRITQKPLMLTLSGAYLAAFGSAGRKTESEWVIFDWTNCESCSQPEDDCMSCKCLKELSLEDIGGIVFEPGNSSGLIKLPPQKLVNTLGKLIKSNNGILMVNEVTTGFGRTGKWFGFQYYDIEPDIVAMGKSIGNGYPVSTVAFTKDIALLLERHGFRYAQSHQNDALGCKVISEVIDIIKEDNLIEKGNNKGVFFKALLDKLAVENICIKEVRGRGLMLGLEFDSNMSSSYSALVHRKLFENGYFVGYNATANILRFYPSLIIEENDIERMVNCLEGIIKV
ncbi:MAG: aspartate aminotransferase family protein [Bacillota bacterium]